MSVYTLKLPFLQISPRVWAEGNRLFARTSLFYQIVNAFFYSRTVVIDTEGRQREKAQAYAELVSKFTGIPLWQERKVDISFSVDQEYRCPQCGHTSNSIVKKCMYCGLMGTRSGVG